MATDHAPVTRALYRLYPKLPVEILDRLAGELTGIVDRGVAQGWDMASIHLSPRKSTPLGLELKKYREAARLLQSDVAETANWSKSKLIRIENGETAPAVTDVSYLLDLYGVKKGTAERARLEHLAKEGRRRRPRS